MLPPKQIDHMSQVMRKPAYAICAHLRSLISAIVDRCLDSIISLVPTFAISRLRLVSVDEQAILSLTLSKTLKTGFLVTWLISLYAAGLKLLLFFHWCTVKIQNIGTFRFGQTVLVCLEVLWPSQHY